MDSVEIVLSGGDVDSVEIFLSGGDVSYVVLRHAVLDAYRLKRNALCEPENLLQAPLTEFGQKSAQFRGPGGAQNRIWNGFWASWAASSGFFACLARGKVRAVGPTCGGVDAT